MGRHGILSTGGTEKTRELMNVTLGKEKADLVLSMQLS